MSEEITVVNEEPRWKSIDEAITYFNQGFIMAMHSLTRLMWEVGETAEQIMEKKAYGESNVEEFAKGIKRTSSWVYECVKMKKAYPWEVIQERFLNAGIPASSVARLACIQDDGARAYVEDKLVSGEIGYEEIAKAKKAYEDRMNDNTNQSDLSDGEEPSMEEQKASQNLDASDPSNVAAAIIRTHFGKLQRHSEEQMLMMEDTLTAYDQLGDISDDTLYELSQDRIVSCGVKLQKQIVYLENIVDTIKKMAPDQFKEE